MASSKVSASDMQMRKYVRRQLKKRGVSPTPKLEERSARERRLRKKFREEYKSKNAPKAGPAKPKPSGMDGKDRAAARRIGVGDAKDRVKGAARKQNLTRGFDAKDRRTGATGVGRSRVGDAKDRMGRKSPTSAKGMYPAGKPSVGDAKDRMKSPARKASPTSAPGMYPAGRQPYGRGKASPTSGPGMYSKKQRQNMIGDAKDRMGKKKSGSSRGRASAR